MAKVDIESFIKEQDLIVADGGITTALYEKGFYINRSFEELCLSDEAAVREVCLSYKKSGAQFLKTNTFNALVPKLTKYGIQDQLKEILVKATSIAKDVAGEEAYVLGTIGPLGLVIEPLGPTSRSEAQDYFTENVKAFAEAQADALLFMGFHDLRELEAGLKAANENSDLPIIAQIGVQESLKTSFGGTLKEFCDLCESYSVVALGISGEVGPSGALSAVEQLSSITNIPLYISPNAGLPRYVNDEYIYMCSPDYIGKFAKRMVLAGAKIVGGNSGVHDNHIQAINNSLRMTKSSQSDNYESYVPANVQVVVDEPSEVVVQSERSKLGKCLAEGKKVVSVEVVPPKGVNISKFMEHCENLEKGGVEFINIPDGARAMARMSSIHLSAHIKKNFNLEPIPHFTTRDRNLIGLQSDLLGAYVNDVRNILVVTGDPPKLGNCPGATAVYDVDAIGLTHILNRMNQGLDLGGSSFGSPSEFLIGVALNPTARNRDLEIKRFRYKIEAGADFAVTQPIYCIESYREFFKELGAVNIPIIMGIWPLVSLRNAEFLKNEVPGVEVPDWAIAEMKKAGDNKELALQKGVDIATQTMKDAQEIVAGFQVSAPFNRVDVAVDVINEAKNW